MTDETLKRIAVGDAGHHVPAVRKSKGRMFEVSRSDKTRLTLFPIGEDVEHLHWRFHESERKFVGARQGDFIGTDEELFDAYRQAYEYLDDIKVDVKSPDGSFVLGKNITPFEAVNLIEDWLKAQRLWRFSDE